MNQTAFKGWYEKHIQAFPNVYAWMGKFPKEANSAGPSQQGILLSWADALAESDEADCLEATRMLSRGVRELPRAFEDHARVVRRIATELRQERFKPARTQIGGQETFRCLLCEDVGLVRVWHPRTMRAAHQGKLFDKGAPRNTCRCLCTCEAKSRWETWWTKSGGLVYDPKLWLKVDENEQESLRDLEQFMEDYSPDVREWEYS